MQLSKQCTWISLNLTRISNHARRWVEGVFSSSMYASSNQMCKREPPKAGPLLFKSPLNKRAIGHFHWAEIGGTERLAGYTRRSTPCVRSSWVSHVFSFELVHQSLTVICRPPDATKWAPDASTTHRTRAQRGSQRRSITGLGAHQTHAQRGLQNALTPDAHHRMHPEMTVISPLDCRLSILNPINHFSTQLRPAKVKPYVYNVALIS